MSKESSPSLVGLLNVRKPPGMTSRAVVDHVQRLVRPAKVGHAGTLDPLAEGVLVLCLGTATRLIPYVQRMAKHYRATFLLGRQSDTDDIDGEVVELPDAPRPSELQIAALLPRWTGTVSQRPPAYSAVKVAGRRAYDLARRGQAVELKARDVEIHSLTLTRYEYPQLELEIVCGSGTYVRALGRDLATALGTAAVMDSLLRSAIGVFRLEESCELDQLTADRIADLLLPPARALAELPQMTLTHVQRQHVLNGRPIETTEPAQEMAAYDAAGHLLAILQQRGAMLWPVRVFSHG